MKITKVIVAVGAAVAAAKTIKQITNYGVGDMLDLVGLERRRNHGWEKLAFFGMGALAGAGAGILLAPRSGRETREKIGDGMEKLATKATDALAEIKEQAPELLSKVTGEPESHKKDENGGPRRSTVR
jgi:hypothetical protein